MQRGERVIEGHVFLIWQGNNFQDESKPALWYWQYRGARNGNKPLSLDMGSGETQAACISDAKSKAAHANQVHRSMRW